ncbi:LCP family protein [Ruminococcaceae bacterium OttesenSCG-928-N02]|nr:LCP family protein [Ruminococcaceae bacterium OttesenSCG-928-N02]
MQRENPQGQRSSSRGRQPARNGQRRPAPAQASASRQALTPQQVAARKRAAQARRKKQRAAKRRRNVFRVLCMLGVGLVVYTLYGVLNGAVMGAQSGQEMPAQVRTPKELRNKVVNILVCGIDYEEGRQYGQNAGMTDVILYVSYNLQANEVHILQIPRDTYIGQEYATGGTGKINAVCYKSEESNPIHTLAYLLHDQFQLTTDYYVTIDMQAFREVIDAIGGIDVYVPQQIQLDGNIIHQGLQTMDGSTAEFFVRYRGYANADIARLDAQRYFYKGLFNKLKTYPGTDVVKVLPAYIKYVETNMTLSTVGRILMDIGELAPENIFIYKVPGEAATYGSYSVFSVHKDTLAQQLNNGFRPFTDDVPADALGVYELAHTVDYISPEGQPLSGIE